MRNAKQGNDLKVRLKMKYEIERFISLKNNNDNFVKKKWIFSSSWVDGHDFDRVSREGCLKLLQLGNTAGSFGNVR